MTHKRGQIVTYRGSAYIATADADGEPGVDPAWSLLARGVPAAGPDGQVLTASGGQWVAADVPPPAQTFSLSSHLKGDWAAATPPVAYFADDVLRHNEGVFVALHDGVTSEPHSAYPDDWAVLVPPANEPAPLSTTTNEDDEVPKQMTGMNAVSATVAGPVTDDYGISALQVTFQVAQPDTYTDGTAATFDHYDVYRFQNDANGQLLHRERIASVLGANNEFTIEQPSTGETYGFQVFAVDQYGIVGIGSNVLGLTLSPGSSGGAPQVQ